MGYSLVVGVTSLALPKSAHGMAGGPGGGARLQGPPLRGGFFAPGEESASAYLDEFTFEGDRDVVLAESDGLSHAGCVVSAGCGVAGRKAMARYGRKSCDGCDVNKGDFTRVTTAAINCSVVRRRRVHWRCPLTAGPPCCFCMCADCHLVCLCCIGTDSYGGDEGADVKRVQLYLSNVFQVHGHSAAVTRTYIQAALVATRGEGAGSDLSLQVDSVGASSFATRFLGFVDQNLFA